MNRVRMIATLATLLAGFGLRAFRLDGQSLWSDEGASVFMTGRSFGDILKAAAGDIHPPLYYLLLRYWSIPTGTSEFAVRFLSVAFGVLLVALVFKLGQRLASRDVGLIAAFLAATSPLLVYYSQEARMYMPMAMLMTLSVLLAMKIWGRVEGRGWRVEEDGEGAKSGKGEKGSGEKGKEGNGGKGSAPFAFSAFNLLPTLFPFSPFPLFPYVLVTAAGLYTQYYSTTILLFENVAFALIFWRFWRHWRVWGLWCILQLAVVALYVPWLLQVMGQLSSWPAVSESFSLQTLLYRVFLVFSFGLSWDMTTTAKTQALFGVLLLAGVAFGWGKRAKGQKESHPFYLFPSLPFALIYLAVPIGVMYYLSLQRPMYNPKFLLLAMPPFYVLLALGVVGVKDAAAGVISRLNRSSLSVLYLSRSVAAGLVLLILVGTAYASSRSLLAYYFDPKYGRDDYRGLARYIDLSGRPGDAIVLNAPGQVEIFGYYYRGSLPVIPLPRQRPIDERVTEEDLKEAAGQYRRVWVVFWAERESDPNGFVERWLNQNAFRTSNKWYGSVRLVLYSVPTSTTAGTVQRQVDANFGDKISLLGYSLAADTGGSPPGSAEQETRPGEVLQLTLFWQALSKLEERYTVFTHLLDPHEHIWGQRDAEPGSGAKPTTGWAPGAVISDNYGIPVFLGTPPGEYFVEVGLYLPATGQRLPVQEKGTVVGDRVLFGPLRVGKADAPPAIESLHVEYPSSLDFGPLRLVGYEFYRLGADRGAVDFRRGDIAHLALFWQARDKPGKDFDVVVQLLDRDGRVVFVKQNPPADGNYLTGKWDKNEIVLDQHKLPLDLPPGTYRLAVGVAGQGGMRELREVVVRRVEGGG